MPTGKNWFQFLFINLIFIVCAFFVVIISFIKQIKTNWPKYRCNPIFMPLSDNVQLDFTYCVQTMQKQMMGTFLQPISWILSNVSELGGSFTTSINNARAMFGNVRFFSSGIFQNIFGVFMNLVIEIQKLTMGIKDLMQKVIGTVVTMVYIMDGVMKTMSSTWNGPVGQLTRGVGKLASGSCFHPETKVKLHDGSIVAMKDLHLGDILENGSKVKATMKIDNENQCSGEKMYSLEKRGVDGEDIWVTGSHYVLDSFEKEKENQTKFIKVEKYSLAKEIQREKIPEWFSCIITSNHRIQIGEETFWDWEDFLLRENNL
jgi:uncharacterized protein YwbE